MKTNEQFGQFSGRDELRLTRLLPGPIERVWSYLTDSEKRGRWLAAGTMDVRVGGKVELRFRHSTLTPHAEEIPEKYKEKCAEDSSSCNFDGIVLRCEPPRLLSYTFGAAGQSEVIFELTPQGSQVLLVLTHRCRGGDIDHLCGYASGWHTHLAILIAKLEERTPPPFWATHGRLEAEYSRLLHPAPAPTA
jgi:uncharacterized protein YndB with AHSA1/START domain